MVKLLFFAGWTHTPNDNTLFETITQAFMVRIFMSAVVGVGCVGMLLGVWDDVVVLVRHLRVWLAFVVG